MTKHSILASALALLLSATAAWAQGNAIKVEPTNWWTGMKNPQVQLMLHSPPTGFTIMLNLDGCDIFNASVRLILLAHICVVGLLLSC